MDALATAASGMRSAQVRLAASAHNVANLGTTSFRPLRVAQSSLDTGGSTAQLQQGEGQQGEVGADSAGVDLTREVVEQIRAGVQFEASARAFAVATEVRGRLFDIFA